MTYPPLGNPHLRGLERPLETPRTPPRPLTGQASHRTPPRPFTGLPLRPDELPTRHLTGFFGGLFLEKPPGRPSSKPGETQASNKSPSSEKSHEASEESCQKPVRGLRRSQWEAHRNSSSDKCRDGFLGSAVRDVGVPSWCQSSFASNSRL